MPREWSPNPDYDRAIERFDAGDAHGSLDYFSRAIRQEPERARIHSNFAMALMKLERFDEALLAARRGVASAEPDDCYPLLVLADALHQTGEFHGVIASMDRVLALGVATNQERARALINKCWALIQLDQNRAAIHEARDAVLLAPDDSTSHLVLATALAGANRWGEALVAIHRALEVAPEDPELVERESLIREGLSRVEEALGDARADVERTPENWQHWLTLGTCLTMTGNLIEASRAFDRAHERNPDPADRWPEAPYMLSPWEADCRIALLEVS